MFHDVQQAADRCRDKPCYGHGNTLVRTLLVRFVLLAVPFQGFAAAAMSCAHGVAAASANEPARSAAKLAAEPATTPPCHGDAAQAGAHTDAQDDAQHEAASSHQQSCGNCSACSVGAAMAPASGSQAPSCCPCNCCPPAAPARLALADPDLPERPPRTTLA